LDKKLILNGVARAVLAYFLLEPFYAFFFGSNVYSDNLYLTYLTQALLGYFAFSLVSVGAGMSAVWGEKGKKTESIFIALGSPVLFHLPFLFNFSLEYLPFKCEIPIPAPVENLYFFLVSFASGVAILIVTLLVKKEETYKEEKDFK
jgi:hypothetical protein